MPNRRDSRDYRRDSISDRTDSRYDRSDQSRRTDDFSEQSTPKRDEWSYSQTSTEMVNTKSKLGLRLILGCLLICGLSKVIKRCQFAIYIYGFVSYIAKIRPIPYCKSFYDLSETSENTTQLSSWRQVAGSDVDSLGVYQ